VWGLDSTGVLEKYFPEAHQTLGALPDGPKGTLPFSLTLDDSRGVQRFHAVFGESPAPLHAIETALRAAQDTTPKLSDGLSWSSAWVRKP